ncbi:hypothetical protein SISNIDRAFT_333467 [Sistotremastrum niveocremeum HHB9708]|uniref:Cora-domain-containing protein n=1 Tax=Sistotremastrum niveocremeum HHB9708 TaxID=1314777 RepID=A0A164XHV8_9AGAM|nr:hypothetical protein SISNIDRAFT_333467 [Sistotremastrum niveocremeum HHB9708]
MRSIGQSLHLHPLTLEDILHQEPREKLDHFPNLGYYLVVFRAIRTPNPVPHDAEPSSSNDSDRTLVGGDSDTATSAARVPTVDAVNVYLVVFKEGIVSFHFGDISEHAERVRSRVLQLESTMRMSSDWIAHGILDSIVDSFFPLLKSIELETEVLDGLVHGFIDAAPKDALHLDIKVSERRRDRISNEEEKGHDDALVGAINEKQQRRPIRRLGPSQLQGIYSELRRFVLWVLPLPASKTSDGSAPNTGSILQRMTHTRILVTSLGRVLAPKSEVIRQLRKRALTGESSLSRSSDSGEIAMYMGDIQDHIITLQQSLDHYERILSSAHPAYLSHLRLSSSGARSGMDKSLFFLTAVTMIVLCMQVLTGVFSINVVVPHNGPWDDRTAPAKKVVFGLVVLANAVVATAVIGMIRWWWVRAKAKYARRKRI